MKVLPISDRYIGYAREIESRMKKEGLRCETDIKGEKIGCCLLYTSDAADD